jgi:hypothetical protein
MYKKYFLLTVIASLIFLLNSRSAMAIAFDLVAPSGTLTRGQEVQFTVNIDTQGSTVTTTQAGITYDTQYLQYSSTVPGETMNSVTVTDLGDGKILLNATNTSGFSGTGVLARVNFLLIAQSAGETSLCTLWAPTPTPTTTTTTTTSTTNVPTQLPVSGTMTKTYLGLGLGAFFLLAAAGNLYLNHKFFYKQKINRKPHTHK